MTDSYRGLFAPVALIGLIHIIGGVAVLVAPQAAYVSQLSGLMMLLPHPIAIAVGLILVGAMAVTARLTKRAERTRAALIAPDHRRRCNAWYRDTTSYSFEDDEAFCRWTAGPI
jgi:hypothetical protein